MKSLSKNKIKWIRSLQLKKNRDDLGLFVVEGEKIVQEALLFAPELIEELFQTHEFIADTHPELNSTIVTNEELKQISSLTTPNKAIAVIRKKHAEFIRQITDLVIVLDGIQDPGNMGTILRIADWFGIRNIVCSLQTVDCYNPKVIQASMGAIFRLNIHYSDLDSWFKNIVDVPIYGALLTGKSVYKSELKTPGILLMGNEGNGISENLISLISHPVTIPRFGEAESLNVAVATGIIVSEFYRSKL